MLTNRDNWTVDKTTGFLAPVVQKVNGNELVTVDQKKQFLQLFEETSNLSAAAKASGMSVRSLYDHLSFDAEFNRSYQEAILALTHEAQSQLVTQMRKGSVIASFGILKRYDPKWRDKQQPDEKKDKDKLKALLDGLEADGSLLNLKEQQ